MKAGRREPRLSESCEGMIRMKHRMAVLKNVIKARAAFDEIARLEPGVPSMALFHGAAGAGKTTTVAWLVGQVKGVYVRANAAWTPGAMLDAILAEATDDRYFQNEFCSSVARRSVVFAGCSPSAPYKNAGTLQRIVAALRGLSLSLFVDEADYLFSGNGKMLDLIRDIHDCSGSPVVLIGMDGIERRVLHRPQLSRRLNRSVEFLPADLDDARVLTDAICEVNVSDDLVEQIYDETKGNVGRMVLCLSRVESRARANGWKSVDVAQWQGAPLGAARQQVARKA